ncbi:hypothetical protein KSP39_PZI021610 [Platanthera zijinensis]|uniref:RRM domain-containing protein n=1 Tax=Platanthera zijinensis TaxID=2320716 RepID=A0AAP0AXE8_9ASPA
MGKRRKLDGSPQSAAIEGLLSVPDETFNEESSSILPSEAKTDESSAPEFGKPINELSLKEEEEEPKAQDLETTDPHPDNSGAGDALSADGEEDGYNDPASLQQLLEPFSKDQLLVLLRDAALNHPDILVSIRRTADADPAHRKIFVHGLGWNATAETLIDAFRQFGEIEDCKAVVDKISGRSKGYGFILFKHRSSARRALKEPQKKIGNKMTACQLASAGPPPIFAPAVVPATTAALPTPAIFPVSELTQRKIYVSNVGSDIDPHKILQFFSKFGEIEEGPLGLDKTTGKPRGFCLFVYKNAESAKRALEEPHRNFEGHILHCQKAIDGPKPNKQPIQFVHGGGQYAGLHQVHTGFVTQGAQFGRIEASVPTMAVPSSSVSGPGHLIAPPAISIRFNHTGQPNSATAAGFNPSLGQFFNTSFTIPAKCMS